MEVVAGGPLHRLKDASSGNRTRVGVDLQPWLRPGDMLEHAAGGPRARGLGALRSHPDHAFVLQPLAQGRHGNKAESWEHGLTGAHGGRP